MSARWWRIPMLFGLAAFGAFWVWALFFASKEAVNRIDDRDWAARAEQICAEATELREELADYTRFDPRDPDGRDTLLAFAGNLDAATDILDEMLDEIVVVAPNDAKGVEIVPMWEDEYRIYLDDRRAFTARLRAGEVAGFRETAVDGLPITERIETFAGDNEMPSCAPPTDMPQ